MEKRRKHERQYADYMRRQREVGQCNYLNLTPLNDARFLSNYQTQTGELPTRDTHEEIMNVGMPSSSIKNNLCVSAECRERLSISHREVDVRA